MALLPLESNPEVLNKLLQKLGVSKIWSLVDVFGLDEDSLAWVPRPVVAVILLFPTSSKNDAYTEKLVEKIKKEGQVLSPDLFFVKQVVSNACGTIALIHSVANNLDKVSIADGPFKDLIQQGLNLSPSTRAELLQKSADAIIDAHKELSMQGQTVANANDDVNHHFVAFICKDGCLYEMDGRKEFPINHGPTAEDTLLEDSAKICQEYMNREDGSHDFTVMALAYSEN